jgi:hypothetical protein
VTGVYCSSGTLQATSPAQSASVTRGLTNRRKRRVVRFTRDHVRRASCNSANAKTLRREGTCLAT